MDWDAKLAKPLSDYCIYVELEDGRKGVFDCKPCLDRGVFRELNDFESLTRSSLSWAVYSGRTIKSFCPDTL